MTKEELIEEINEMCNEMIDNKEYVDEVLGNKDLYECSVGLLYQKRKLGQVYLSEYCIIKKDEIDKQIHELDKVITTKNTYDTLKEGLDSLNSGDYTSMDNNYSLSQLKEGIQYIQRLIKNERISGEFKVISNLKVEFKPDLPKLQLKVDLLREAQRCDRALQRHMRKKAPCTVGDSNYELRIRNLQERINEMEAMDEA